MEYCLEDLRDSGRDLRGVPRRFESHGWRSKMEPSRPGLPYVKASISSIPPYRAVRIFIRTVLPCLLIDMRAIARRMGAR